MHLDSSLRGTNGIGVATGGRSPSLPCCYISALGLISLLLPTQVAEVSPCLEALCCEAKALARDTAQAESGFTTVKSEKDLPGLQGLQSRQQEMEVSLGAPWPAGCLAGEVSGLDEAIPGRRWPPGAQVSSALARCGVQAGIFQWSPARAREGRALTSAPVCQRPAASASLIFPSVGR